VDRCPQDHKLATIALQRNREKTTAVSTRRNSDGHVLARAYMPAVTSGILTRLQE